MEPMEIKISGYAVIEKVAREMGTTCRLPCPREWLGKKVKMVLLEPIEGKEPRIRKIKEKHPDPAIEMKTQPVQPIPQEPVRNVINQRPIVFRRMQ